MLSIKEAAEQIQAIDSTEDVELGIIAWTLTGYGAAVALDRVWKDGSRLSYEARKAADNIISSTIF